jgi:hypothetical protein
MPQVLKIMNFFQKKIFRTLKQEEKTGERAGERWAIGERGSRNPLCETNPVRRVSTQFVCFSEIYE